MVTGGLSHKFVENSALKLCMKTLQPQFKLPTRKAVAKKWIPMKYKEVEAMVKESIDQAEFVAISSDGWTDNRQRAIINTVVHTPTPFLYRSDDTLNNEHTGVF